MILLLLFCYYYRLKFKREYKNAKLILYIDYILVYVLCNHNPAILQDQLDGRILLTSIFKKTFITV